jgi:hypothetical protein
MPYYADSWSGRLAPQADTDGLVFNYTYTLPQFLRSIYFLLTTIAALEPNSLHLYANVLTRCLTRLQSVHQTIVSSGIIAARIPSMDEVGVIDGDVIPPFTTNWILNDGTPNPTYFPYGAVERYSGANNMGSYIGDHFPYWGADLTTWWEPTAENFLTLLSFWTVGKMKSLYVELGMPAVWQAINQLLQLTGQPLQSTPPYSAWSFAEVTSLLGLRLPPPRRWPPVVPVWFQEPPGCRGESLPARHSALRIISRVRIRPQRPHLRSWQPYRCHSAHFSAIRIVVHLPHRCFARAGGRIRGLHSLIPLSGAG